MADLIGNPYLAGMLYGDGTCYRGKNGAYAVWVDQSERNRDILELMVIPRLARLGFNVHVYRYRDKRHGIWKWRALVYSKALFMAFLRLRRNMLQYVEELDDAGLCEFTAGLFDAEGTVTDRLVIYNSDLELLVLLKRRLSRLGVEARIYRFGPVFGLQIHRKEDMLKFAEMVPSLKLRGVPARLRNIGGRKPERVCTAPESWPVPVPEARVQPGQGPVNAGSNSDSLKVAKCLVG